MVQKTHQGSKRGMANDAKADPPPHTHTRLTALFWDYPGEPVPER